MTLAVTAIICAVIALLGLYFQVRYSARTVTQGPALLTMLGIAGTFLGIAIGLYHFSATNVQGSIPGLIDGIRTSVWASFTGIFFAILIKVRYALAHDEDSSAGDRSDVEILVDELRAIKASIALDGDLALTSEIKLVRAEINYRLDVLQRSQAEFVDRLTALSSKIP